MSSLATHCAAGRNCPRPVTSLNNSTCRERSYCSPTCQLVSEGFAVGRRGSGTYVSSGTALIQSASVEETAQLRLARFGSRAAAAHSKVSFPDPQGRPLPYDFAYGRSDLETFPLAAWRRILLKCVRTASAAALDYGPASGDAALREAIAAHLRRARAVSCDPSQVIVVNGSQQALDLIAAFSSNAATVSASRIRAIRESSQSCEPQVREFCRCLLTGKVWIRPGFPRALA